MFPPQPPDDDPFSLPEPPTAPTAPEPARINKALAFLALGLGLRNPEAGAAAFQGLQRAKQQKDIEARQQYEAAQVAQQRAEAIDQARQRMLMTAMGTLKEYVPKLTKAQYDQVVSEFERQIRVRPNVLRALVPYRAPNANEQITAALDRMFKHPANKGAIASSAILDGAVQVDTDGDGIPDLPIPVRQAIQEVSYPVVLVNGQLVPAPKTGTPSEFERALTIETDIFQAEKGRAPQSPKEQALVYDKAQKRAQKPATERQILPVVIQTSEGPQVLDRRTRTVQPIVTAAGEQVQPAPTADMRNKVAARKLVQRSITAVEAISKRIIRRVGPAQRAEAIKRGAEAVFGNDPEFRTYQDARTALAGNLAVAQQGSRPSDADIKAIWLPLVPDAYRDTAESAQMKWDLIRVMSLPEGVGESVSAPPAVDKLRNR